MRMKKQLTLDELKKLFYDGAIIDADCSLDTIGTCGGGYVERRGITINGRCFQVVYSSRGYGRITSRIRFYNGKFLHKHIQYMDAVREHFNEHIMPYIRSCRLFNRQI